MDINTRRKQIIYRANHRGIKEMDLLLGRFASNHAGTMGEDELARLETIMAESDRDLLSWFTGEIDPPGHLDRDMFDRIAAHARETAGSST